MLRLRNYSTWAPITQVLNQSLCQAGTNLGWAPTHRRSHTLTETHSVTPYGADLESPINIYCVVLDSWRKPENLEEAHIKTNTGRAHKLRTERSHYQFGD